MVKALSMMNQQVQCNKESLRMGKWLEHTKSFSKLVSYGLKQILRIINVMAKQLNITLMEKLSLKEHTKMEKEQMVLNMMKKEQKFMKEIMKMNDILNLN